MFNKWKTSLKHLTSENTKEGLIYLNYNNSNIVPVIKSTIDTARSLVSERYTLSNNHKRNFHNIVLRISIDESEDLNRLIKKIYFYLYINPSIN